MAKFKNTESGTLHAAFNAWLRAMTLENGDAGITALPEAEIWAAIREERNARLRECDWVLIEDSPKSSNEKKTMENVPAGAAGFTASIRETGGYRVAQKARGVSATYQV